MKISEKMSIEDLLSIVLDEDDDYSWSSRSEARNAVILKFNIDAKKEMSDALCVCETKNSARPWFLHALNCPCNNRHQRKTLTSFGQKVGIIESKLDLFMTEVKSYDYKWFDEIGGNEALQEIEELRKQ